jgi:hypothetical protein
VHSAENISTVSKSDFVVNKKLYNHHFLSISSWMHFSSQPDLFFKVR